MLLAKQPNELREACGRASVPVSRAFATELGRGRVPRLPGVAVELHSTVNDGMALPSSSRTDFSRKLTLQVSDYDVELKQVRATDKVLSAARESADKRITAAQQRRDRAVKRAHDAGASLQTIADVLGVHRSYVHQIVKAIN